GARHVRGGAGGGLRGEAEVRVGVGVGAPLRGPPGGGIGWRAYERSNGAEPQRWVGLSYLRTFSTMGALCASVPPWPSSASPPPSGPPARAAPRPSPVATTARSSPTATAPCRRTATPRPAAT